MKKKILTPQQSIAELEEILLKLDKFHTSFDYIRISLASPTRIRSWAQRVLPSGEIIGEIKSANTLDFRNHEPLMEGLFCPRIFGPSKNWECMCKKYQGVALDKVCDVCLVELTEARVRRYRMGFMDLYYPVLHLWYLKALPNYLCILLRCLEEDFSLDFTLTEKEKEDKIILPSDIENLVYFKKTGRPLPECLASFRAPMSRISTAVLTENEKTEPQNKLHELLQSLDGKKPLPLFYGVEILQAALESLDLKYEVKKWRLFLDDKLNRSRSIQASSRIVHSKKYAVELKRIRILESFLASKTQPSWMILSTLPVLPPSLRPLMELENGLLVSADVNHIYHRIYIRNNNGRRLAEERRFPGGLIEHSFKILQLAVDSLIDNARVPKERQIVANNKKALIGLTEILEGKEGRFRQSLLGKRVDYSGRSVIVVGPTLRLNQCGLPYEMAKELFQPFLINQLLKTKIRPSSHNTRFANSLIKKNRPFVWTLLALLTQKYSVLLNRAPTLHRFGIQAFDPVLILGQAIQLHPLVCTGFNADFDGDQMAIHLPLYEASQLEIKTMMRPSYNVLSPANGEVILKPTQDMVIGAYYLTLMITNHKHLQKSWFPNEDSALAAFYQKKITIHTPILVRYSIKDLDCRLEKKEIKFSNQEIINSFVNPLTTLLTTKSKVCVYKIFKVDTGMDKYYLLTNLGILILYKSHPSRIIRTDAFQDLHSNFVEHSKTSTDQNMKTLLLKDREQITRKEIKEIRQNQIDRSYYKISDLFSETTAGRILFTQNFTQALKNEP